jgi:hypothetical protein
MPSSWMLHRVALIRTDISEERIASVIRVTRISELGTTLAVTSNWSLLWRNILVTLMMEATCFTEILVLTRSTRHHVPEDGILCSHCHQNLRSYASYFCLSLQDYMCKTPSWAVFGALERGFDPAEKRWHRKTLPKKDISGCWSILNLVIMKCQV